MARYVKRGKSWQYEISYKDETGKFQKLRKSGFSSKSAAIAEAGELESKLAKGYRERKDQPLSDYFLNWMEIYKKNKISVHSYLKYEYTYKVILKYFPDVTIKTLTRQRYQELLNNYALTHSTASTTQINIQIRASLSNLIDEGIIFNDFTKGVITTGGKASKPENDKYLNFTDFQAVITKAKESISPRFTSALMIYVGAKTGMRFSELQGLTWDHVKFNSQQIEIVRTWDATTGSFSATKNVQSIRTIPIDKETINVLRTARKSQIKYFKKLEIDSSIGFVFYNLKNGLISNNAANKILKKYCRELGIHQITMHGLRHTYASTLLYRHVSLIVVSKLLGHSSVSVTQDVYSHVLKELELEATDNIRKILEAI